MEAVLVALIAQAGALVLFALQNKRQHRENLSAQSSSKAAVDTLTEKVQTNHGKEPREYLEMVMEVRDMVRVNRDDQSALVRMIAEHTLQDERNFAALRSEIKALSA